MKKTTAAKARQRSIHAKAVIARRLAAMIATSFMMAGPASAASLVYTGSQQVGDVSAVYSITTDGSLGNLSATNVIGYTLALTHSGATTTLNSQNSGIRGAFTASTDTLSAVDTSQFFQINSNFAPNPNAVPGAPVAVGYSDFIDVSYYGTQAQLRDGTNRYGHTNNAAGFASVQGAITPGVPEPATWAMMLIGFGIVGVTARYRRRSTTTTFA